jgi:hypothetical protein
MSSSLGVHFHTHDLPVTVLAQLVDKVTSAATYVQQFSAGPAAAHGPAAEPPVAAAQPTLPGVRRSVLQGLEWLIVEGIKVQDFRRRGERCQAMQPAAATTQDRELLRGASQ